MIHLYTKDLTNTFVYDFNEVFFSNFHYFLFAVELHTMLIIFMVTIAAVLIETNSTMNAGNVNTIQKERGTYIFPLSPNGTKTSIDHESGNNIERGKYIVPLSPEGTKTSIDHESGNNTERGKYIVPLSPKGTKTSIDHESGNNTERGKYIVPLSPIGTKTSIDHESGNNTEKTTAGTKSQAGTTDNYIKDTKNEQENFSYSAVADPPNSSLATTNSTPFSHDRDNSEHIWTIVIPVVSLLVIAVVVGLLFLRCKRKAKYIPMVKKTIKTSDEPVDVENINTPYTTEDEVDISSENTNSPVCVYIASKYSNIQPTDARE